MITKALSIQQPWAWLIVNGYKLIENRSWYTHFRGEFYVHSSKGFDQEGYECILDEFPEINMPPKESFERGGIVGKANFVDCVSESDSEWFSGPYGFVLADVGTIKFTPCKGALGFWDASKVQINET